MRLGRQAGKTGVATVSMLAKIRRMHFRNGLHHVRFQALCSDAPKTCECCRARGFFIGLFRAGMQSDGAKTGARRASAPAYDDADSADLACDCLSVPSTARAATTTTVPVPIATGYFQSVCGMICGMTEIASAGRMNTSIARMNTMLAPSAHSTDSGPVSNSAMLAQPKPAVTTQIAGRNAVRRAHGQVSGRTSVSYAITSSGGNRISRRSVRAARK
ncbi:hypothetical protein DM992_15030 [Burkholderia sp. JP2-270]|nr:hypothetical protein DM992_15030 [Burkholderia sp. JP2-270]